MIDATGSDWLRLERGKRCDWERLGATGCDWERLAATESELFLMRCVKLAD